MNEAASTTPKQQVLPTAGRRAIAVLLLVAALALIASSAELHGWITRLLPYAEAVIRHQPVLGILVFILFASASAMLAFVSSAVIVPIGVYVWGEAVCMLLLWTGWTLGGICSYALSRFLGRRVVKFLRSEPVLERYETSISHHAPFGLMLLFQLAVPSEVPGYLLGLANYSFWKYFAALAVSELLYAVATTYIGASFIEGRAYAMILLGCLLAGLAGGALHLLHRRIVRARS